MCVSCSVTLQGHGGGSLAERLTERCRVRERTGTPWREIQQSFALPEDGAVLQQAEFSIHTDSSVWSKNMPKLNNLFSGMFTL